jgi:Ca2+-binding RTX toxin-like protein
VDLGYGQDQVLASARRDGSDTIEGDGRDAVVYLRRTSPVTVDLRSGIAGAPGEDDRIFGIRFATGGRAGDRMLGDGKANELAGGGGNDLIRGGRGDDDLGGEAGVDELGGGPGQDFLFSDDGRSELVDCGAGPDFAFADDLDLLNACEEVSTRRAPLSAADRFPIRMAPLIGSRAPDALHRHLTALLR